MSKQPQHGNFDHVQRQGDAVHFVVPTWQDSQDIREGARRFWEKRNLAPPNEVNNGFGKHDNMGNKVCNPPYGWGHNPKKKKK